MYRYFFNLSCVFQFPVIGQFLHLVYNVLNINAISQLELERMLLMPQASKTLATLMTSMLMLVTQCEHFFIYITRSYLSLCCIMWVCQFLSCIKALGYYWKLLWACSKPSMYSCDIQLHVWSSDTCSRWGMEKGYFHKNISWLMRV